MPGHRPRALPLSPVLHGELAALQVAQTRRHSGATLDFSPVPPAGAVSHPRKDLGAWDGVSLVLCPAPAALLDAPL